MSRWNRLRSLVSTPRGGKARRRSPWRASACSGLEPLEPRVLLTTVGVYDENVIATNGVDFTATGSSMSVEQFKADMATAFARNNGGVIDGSIYSGSYNFGVGQRKSLRLVTVGDSTWGTGVPGENRPISGTGAFSILGLQGTESYRSVTFSFSMIANGDPGEQVVQFGVTALSLTGRDYGAVTTTGHLASGGSLTASRAIKEPNGWGDTFFGLAAPAGDHFTGFTLGYSGPVTAPDYRLWFDDIGFITAAPSAGNQPPVAVDDTYEIDEDASLTIAAPGVLGNDHDADIDPLTAVLVSRPANGIVRLQPDGSFRYIPAFNFFGTDSFTYRANDGTADSDVATVTITVNPVNDAPFVESPTVTTDEDAPITRKIDSIDVEGDPYTFALLTDAAHGTAVVNSDGTFTYTPDRDFHGADSFTFRATDAKGAARDGAVTLIVRSVNDAPVARDNFYRVDQGQILTLAPAAPITRLVMESAPGDFVGRGASYAYTTDTANVSARKNFDNGVSLSVIQPATGGDWWYLDFAAPSNAPLAPGVYEDAGRFAFRDPGQPGLDVYGNGRGHDQLVGEFVVYDVEYGTDNAVTRFAATFVQRGLDFDGALGPPMTGVIQYNTTIGAGSGVLANDGDVDGDLLRAILVSGPANGALSLNPDGTFSYTPDAGFYGIDSFTYVANDGRLDSNVATVTITVDRVNKAPVAADIAVSTDEDTPLAIDVSANVTDPDGDPSTIVVLTGPASGALEANQDGTFTYTPFDNFNGADRFTYKANDGEADSNVATVTIIVNAINDGPTISVPGPVTVEEGESAVIGGISVADVDVEEGTGEVRVTLSVPEGTLTVATDVVGGLAAGQVVDNGTGAVVLEGPIKAVNATLAAGVTYLGRVDFRGDDALMVIVNDLGNNGGDPLSATDTVSIRVLPREDLTVADVIAAVERLRDDGILNKGQTNALVVKLENADRAMDRGQDKVFLNMLGAFVNQVNAFIAQGILTPEQGWNLLDAAERLRKGGLWKKG